MFACSGTYHRYRNSGLVVVLCVFIRNFVLKCVSFQLEFFGSGANPCQVMDGEEGVLFVKKLGGRATGDAFVLFRNEEDGDKAISKHREVIGTRYIELFRSTIAEVQQVSMTFITVDLVHFRVRKRLR